MNCFIEFFTPSLKEVSVSLWTTVTIGTQWFQKSSNIFCK